MLGTDRYAYQSKIKNVNPVDKLLLMLAVLLLCIFLDHWAVSLATLFAMVWMNRFFGGNTMSSIVHLFYIPAGFIFIGTLTVVLGRVDAGEMLLGVRLGTDYYGVTAKSLRLGAEIVAKSFGIMSSVYFFVMNTTISDLSVAMEKLRVPRLFTELMELIYRFIFVLMQSAGRIKIAQNSRLGYKDLKTSYRSTGTLAARVFVEAMRRSDKIYHALDSRGYQGQILTLGSQYEKNESMIGAGIVITGIQIGIFMILRLLG